MVDHSITITNSVLFVGYNPTNTWGTLVWGTDAWRFTGEGVQDVDKPITNSTTWTSDEIKDIEHLTDMGSTLLSTELVNSFGKPISNSFALSTDIVDMYLTDADGYYYLYPGDVTNADNRVDASWGESSSTTATWGAASSTSAVWS